MLGGFDEYPADVAVAFLRDVTMRCMVAGLMGAGCEPARLTSFFGDENLAIGTISLMRSMAL
jgi:hypothetical protein